MMETYAQRLQKRKEGKMSNYDLDEIERERDRNAFASVKTGDVEQEERSVEIDLDHKDLLKLALAAHDRNITLNKMCGIVIKDSLKDLNYRFEHKSKPQVLKEY